MKLSILTQLYFSKREGTNLPGTFGFLLQKLILLSVAILAQHSPRPPSAFRPAPRAAEPSRLVRFRVSQQNSRAPLSSGCSAFQDGRTVDGQKRRATEATMRETASCAAPSWRVTFGGRDWWKGRTGAGKVTNQKGRRGRDGQDVRSRGERPKPAAGTEKFLFFC